MHPIAFSIGNLQIHWYGITAALGFLVALSILILLRKRAGFTKDNMLDIGMISLFGGISGARIFYIIEFRDQFIGRSPVELVRIDKGGLVFYGGFILALSIIFVYTRLKKVSFFALLDVFGPAMAISHAVGRIGCFLQGCCFGKPAGDGFFGKLLGVVYPAGSAPALKYPAAALDLYADTPAADLLSLPLWPTQLIESGCNILLGIILLLLLPHLKKTGQGASAYLIGYGIIRFIVECFRGDHRDFFLGIFTPSQTIALFIMIPLGIFFFILAGKIGKQNVGNPEI